MKRNKLKNRMLVALLFCGLGFYACIPDKVVDFKGDGIEITAYLENNELYDYSEFLKWMKVVGVDGMLNARGNYTCFVPTDDAIMKYYEEKSKTFEDMLPEDIAELVYGHIIKIDNPASDPVESKFFPNGTIGHPNMRSRFIQISYDSIGGMIVNQTAKILLKDQGHESPYYVRNGVVHTIDRVLEPSRALVSGLAEVHTDRFSLFVQALKVTGLIDSLQASINEDYDKRYKRGEIPEYMTSYTVFCDAGSGYCTPKTGKMKTPTSWLIGFTVMMESNETFSKAGINTLDDLRRFAEDNMVPKKPGTFNNPTNRNNSLNRFIAYHILDRTWDLNDFIPEAWQKFYVPNTVLIDYTPTMSPFGMIEVQRDREGPMLNKRKDGTAVRVLRIEKNNRAENGFFHELDRVLVYDEGVENDVLNKRIRIDVTSLLSEMHTNRLVGNCGFISEGGTGGRIFPKGYFKNFVEISDGTQIQYGGPMNYGWNNLHLDEFLIGGKFDLKIKLPPLPPATYEIRVHFTSNGNRGVLQIFLNKDPLGIPLNMGIDASDPRIGYIKPGTDPNDPDGLENDKMMRNRGYMKGPATINSVITGGEPLRLLSRSIRRVLTTERIEEGVEYWLRFKTVEDRDTREFMFDFLEFVPTSCLENEDNN